ncbi:MAG: GUN4 domain-containing protein [Prochloraceae cyanobacterium]
MTETISLVGKTLLSRYVVLKQIGRGGFAYTYLAIDTALPNRPYCVVKRLSPQNPNEQKLAIAKKLFEREAKSLYHLGEHDRIPRLYAHFCQDEQFYLVQEFIEGTELSEEIEPDRQLSEVETIELLREILEVLKVIHDGNIIHRDLKPSNIMRRKKDGKLVIIDFGIVKEFDFHANRHQPNTTKIGSSGYMSPEQSLGYPQLASDIYAVGVIGIIALSGLRPKDIKVDSKSGEIFWRDRVKMSDKLADFYSKMMCFDFQKRYQNADEALTALNEIFPETISSARKKRRTTQNIVKSLTVTLGSILGLISIGIAAKFLINANSYTKDLVKLEEHLSQQNWQEADLVTDRILIESIGNELQIDAIESNLNCQELIEVNQLWKQYSDGEFGFTVQKQIYLETGRELQEYSLDNYQDFRDRVENNSAVEAEKPPGYYPTLSTIYPQQKSLHSLAHWIVLERTQVCGL